MDATPRCSASAEVAGLVQFIAETRQHVHLRACDRMLILRPNKVFRLNETAWEILSRLYDRRRMPDPLVVAGEVAAEYGVPTERVLADACSLARTVSGLLQDDLSGCGNIRRVGLDGRRLEWPILSEIALTYGCQNRCRFCYASSPDRAAVTKQMSADDVRCVIDRIAFEAHCPSLSFTGGEPTLVPELPAHIAYAKAQGLRVNLITNGIRCSDCGYAEGLAEAGLDSAQVSLEAGTADLHDAIVGRAGAFESTVAGVRQLRRVGIHTHTNTTICGLNKHRMAELVSFVARELESAYFSLNIVIRTGSSLRDADMDITYAELREIVPPLFDLAERLGVRAVWYSPTPLCVFNPMEYGVPSSTCACCESLLSVNPSGDVLPCSSFESGVGNLLRSDFETVWRSKPAVYWRSKAAAPPGCSECEYFAACLGACPLYWDDRGNFDEIGHSRPRPSRLAALRWARLRRTRGLVFGVGVTAPGGGPRARGERHA